MTTFLVHIKKTQLVHKAEGKPLGVVFIWFTAKLHIRCLLLPLQGVSSIAVKISVKITPCSINSIEIVQKACSAPDFETIRGASDSSVKKSLAKKTGSSHKVKNWHIVTVANECNVCTRSMTGNSK